jgi:glycosyltransferase involved in cell wall biosynthesis
VTPYLDRAAVVAVPVRSGGGMRLKVLEALAAGKAVVASPVAVEGLDLPGDSPLVVASGDDTFADEVLRLLRDPDARARLGRKARCWASAHASWDATLDAYDQLYDRLVESARSRRPSESRASG